MKNVKNLVLFFALALTLTSCIDNDKEFEWHYYQDYELMSNVLDIDLDGPPKYDLNFPAYYGRVNSFDEDEATLGRVIFYDEKLSADGKISCASCHKQELAFSDDKALSDGINNEITGRNSLALGAVFNFQEYYGTNRVPFFWDNSISTVEEQIVTTFGSKKEMDMTIDQVVAVMNDNDYYKPLIRAVTGSDVATNELAVRALAVFVNSIGSFDSKFDKALSTETGGGPIGFGRPDEAYNNFRDFTAQENAGKDIYLQSCATCHGEIMGAPNELAASNGLARMDDDLGFEGTRQFKVPSLRNLTLTYPYMHDGRFATIEDVVDHYSTGLQDVPELHFLLKDGSGNPKKFNFSDQEKEDLIVFLKTFDDPDFLTDKKYSDPFMK